MGSEWKEVELGQVLDVVTNSYKPNENEVLPYLGLEHIEQGTLRLSGIGVSTDVISNKYRFEPNDILFGKLRPYFRKVYKPRFSGVCSTDIMVLRTKDCDIADQSFLFYVIASKKFIDIATASSKGTKMPRADWDHLKKMMIKLPSIKIQQKIASILSAFDDKIELNNEMNKTLEEIAQAIFKHWFIDFEFPNENGEPYKSSGGEFVDSELGPIPKGWEVKALDEIADFLNGLAMQKYRPVDENNYLPVLKIRELKQGATSSDSDKCRTDIDPRYIVDDGDVIFSWSGSLEVRVWCGGKAGLNQHLFKVSSEKYPKWFYYYWIKYHLNDFRRIAEDKATTMGHIKREHLSQAKVIVPDDEWLKEFDRILSPLIEFYISNGREVKILSQLRDTLLPKLISGEIRVM
ncbi:restriction endonuclease subunit S [Caldanaerobius polysaccharolyticus]|uniref:restriction endonuclease subunit S n=1 Tax=Caldanaerobius polysaccharolyticus TaxID=44256 RepID=UPI00047B28DA|nr:restriction endonuclease subunit S [Caldanaerobius polysaccharolyticus]